MRTRDYSTKQIPFMTNEPRRNERAFTVPSRNNCRLQTALKQHFSSVQTELRLLQSFQRITNKCIPCRCTNFQMPSNFTNKTKRKRNNNKFADIQSVYFRVFREVCDIYECIYMLLILISNPKFRKCYYRLCIPTIMLMRLNH